MINGDFYIGGYKQNLWHGKGKYHLMDGRIAVGDYIDGKPEGPFKYYLTDGTEQDKFYFNGIEQ